MHPTINTAMASPSSAFILSDNRFASWNDWATNTRPTDRNRAQWKKAKHHVILALHNSPLKVKEVLSCGSTSKATVIRDRLEVDFAIVVDSFRKELSEKYKHILKDWIVAHLDVCDARVLSDCVRFTYDGVSIDVDFCR